MSTDEPTAQSSELEPSDLEESTLRFDDSDNPYVGPRSFRPGEILYGRDREVIDLRDILIAQRIVLLYSPSGAGKSSLVEAGLRPLLTADGFTVLPTMRVGHEPPPAMADVAVRNRYAISALLSLDEGLVADRRSSAADLGSTTLDSYLTRLENDTKPAGADRAPNVCLVFDQFEELFTLDPTDLEQKATFIDEVGIALRAPNRWAIFSMREDFIAQLDPYVSKVPKRLSTRYRLDLLGPDAARVAIREPARRRGVDFTAEAADHLIDDLRRVRVQRGGKAVDELGPYVEPVHLQVVCRRLWNSMAR